MVDEPADIERRLDAGEWLRPGEVAVLTGLGRTTIHELIRDRKWRYKKTPGGHRTLHPDDVRALLAEVRRVHGAADAGPDETQA